jgi:hypothetical protein
MVAPLLLECWALAEGFLLSGAFLLRRRMLMCYREPHFAPVTEDQVLECATKQIAAESRRLSFALWSLINSCPTERLEALSRRNRQRINDLIWDGWCKQSINLPLSVLRQIVEELGGELELVAVPCTGTEARWNHLSLRCQTSNSAEIAMLLNQLHSAIPWQVNAGGSDYAKTWRDRYAQIAALSSLHATTVRAALCFYHIPKFRTVMLMAVAMRHRVFLRVRKHGFTVSRRNEMAAHATYIEHMRRRTKHLVLST